MKPSLINLIPALEGEELVYLKALTQELPEERLLDFVTLYNGKRRKTDEVLIGCVLGFVCIAGVQRIMLKQIGMGLLYFFTGGLCLIGTVMDIINHKRLTFEFNQKMAMECMAMMHAYR